MSNLLYCGLDVDDNAFHAFLINSSGEFYEFSCRPNLKHLLEKLEKFKDRDLKICYEATYLGFSLCRDLRKENFNCVVIAPNLIPEMSGAKIKTDKKDAKKLAIYLMKELLTEVNVPDIEDEAERDLTRTRTFIQEQLKQLKNHIQATLRRMGLDYKKETGKLNYWTDDYLRWLREVTSKDIELPLKENLLLLQTFFYQHKEMLSRYDLELSKLCELPKYKKRVEALKCYRGIADLSAIIIVTEIGDINRFAHPRKLMSYLGFDVCEYSSGGKENKYGITKAGNSQVRRILVEASQSCDRPPKVHYGLTTRREKVDHQLIEIADRCMNRLYKKAYQMNMKNKNKNKIKVACAREMTGFIWESLKRVA